MLDRADNELISRALNYWANWIETGDVTLSSSDAIDCDMHKIIKPLSLDQQKLVVRLKELAINQIF
jgi:hypothetical protein